MPAEFAHATPQLIGLALGIYGLTQGLLQIPLGLLSDRIGRKPVMSVGFAIFLLRQYLRGIDSQHLWVNFRPGLTGSGRYWQYCSGDGC